MADPFSGFVEGHVAAQKMGMMREERARKLAEKKQADKLKALEAQRRIRPLIEDAYKNLGEDSKQLNAALKDIFAAYQLETGQEVHPDIQKAFADPQFGMELLASSTETGTTLGEIFEEGRQPLLRAEARIALGARIKQRETQAALTGEQRGEAAEPEQLAGPEGPAAPAAAQPTPAAATPAVNPRLKPFVDQIDAQIAGLERRRAVAIRNNAAPAAYAGLDQQLKDLRERKAKLTEGVAQTGVEVDIRRRGEAAPEAVQRETGALTRGEQEDRRAPLATPQQMEAETLELREAAKVRGDIRTSAEAARRDIPLYQRTAALIEQAGRTGANIGPLRQFLGEAGQLVLPDRTVQRLLKLSDLELLNQANIEFALAGLKDVGGNDTERELLTLMRSKPGILNTQQANRFAVRWALADRERKLERETAADKWIEDRRSEGKPASLRSRNARGQSFNQRWDEYVNRRPLFAQVARDLGMDPVEFAASLGYDRERASQIFGAR